MHNEQKIMVTINNNEPVQVNADTTLYELSKTCQSHYSTPILLAIINNKIRELNKTVREDCSIRFIDASHPDGMRVYQRSLCFILICAVKEVLGRDAQVLIEHSIARNLYCEIKNAMAKLTDESLAEIERVMHRLVDENHKIEKFTMSLDDGLKIMRKEGMEEKVRVLKYRRVSSVNLYCLKGVYDYFYGYMAPYTGGLTVFKLIRQYDGFMLQFPPIDNPTVLGQFTRSDKISGVFRETAQWNRILKINTVGALNDTICKEETGDMIRIAEALHEKKLAQIADQINLLRDTVKVILIAGPSSSGKTTFAERLRIQLRVNGIYPHVVSIDNYFTDLEHTPRDADGNYDFESIEHVDVAQFNDHLKRLLKGETVHIPTYNFHESRQEYRGNYLKLKENQVLLVEGIHGLNEVLTSEIPRENKFLIYISALTQLNIDDHNRIPTTDTRLIRRIVRDNRTRGAKAEATLSQWSSVLRGEVENIFPYQENSDAIFNSALLYELCILKPLVEPLLFTIDDSSPYYSEAQRLIKFLDSFLPVGSGEIPNNSILREFVGGSCFHD